MTDSDEPYEQAGEQEQYACKRRQHVEQLVPARPAQNILQRYIINAAERDDESEEDGNPSLINAERIFCHFTSTVREYISDFEPLNGPEA